MSSKIEKVVESNSVNMNTKVISESDMRKETKANGVEVIDEGKANNASSEKLEGASTSNSNLDDSVPSQPQATDKEKLNSSGESGVQTSYSYENDVLSNPIMVDNYQLDKHIPNEIVKALIATLTSSHCLDRYNVSAGVSAMVTNYLRAQTNSRSVAQVVSEQNGMKIIEFVSRKLTYDAQQVSYEYDTSNLTLLNEFDFTFYDNIIFDKFALKSSSFNNNCVATSFSVKSNSVCCVNKTLSSHMTGINDTVHYPHILAESMLYAPRFMTVDTDLLFEGQTAVERVIYKKDFQVNNDQAGYENLVIKYKSQPTQQFLDSMQGLEEILKKHSDFKTLSDKNYNLIQHAIHLSVDAGRGDCHVTMFANLLKMFHAVNHYYRITGQFPIFTPFLLRRSQEVLNMLSNPAIGFGTHPLNLDLVFDPNNFHFYRTINNNGGNNQENFSKLAEAMENFYSNTWKDSEEWNVIVELPYDNLDLALTLVVATSDYFYGIDWLLDAPHTNPVRAVRREDQFIFPRRSDTIEKSTENKTVYVSSFLYNFQPMRRVKYVINAPQKEDEARWTINDLRYKLEFGNWQLRSDNIVAALEWYASKYDLYDQISLANDYVVRDQGSINKFFHRYPKPIHTYENNMFMFLIQPKKNVKNIIMQTLDQMLTTSCKIRIIYDTLFSIYQDYLLSGTLKFWRFRKDNVIRLHHPKIVVPGWMFSNFEDYIKLGTAVCGAFPNGYLETPILRRSTQDIYESLLTCEYIYSLSKAPDVQHCTIRHITNTDYNFRTEGSIVLKGDPAQDKPNVPALIHPPQGQSSPYEDIMRRFHRDECKTLLCGLAGGRINLWDLSAYHELIQYSNSGLDIGNGKLYFLASDIALLGIALNNGLISQGCFTVTTAQLLAIDTVCLEGKDLISLTDAVRNENRRIDVQVDSLKMLEPFDVWYKYEVVDYLKAQLYSRNRIIDVFTAPCKTKNELIYLNGVVYLAGIIYASTFSTPLYHKFTYYHGGASLLYGQQPRYRVGGNNWLNLIGTTMTHTCQNFTLNANNNRCAEIDVIQNTPKFLCGYVQYIMTHRNDNEVCIRYNTINLYTDLCVPILYSNASELYNIECFRQIRSRIMKSNLKGSNHSSTDTDIADFNNSDQILCDDINGPHTYNVDYAFDTPDETKYPSVVSDQSTTKNDKDVITIYDAKDPGVSFKNMTTREILQFEERKPVVVGTKSADGNKIERKIANTTSSTTNANQEVPAAVNNDSSTSNSTQKEEITEEKINSTIKPKIKPKAKKLKFAQGYRRPDVQMGSVETPQADQGNNANKDNDRVNTKTKPKKNSWVSKSTKDKSKVTNEENSHYAFSSKDAQTRPRPSKRTFGDFIPKSFFNPEESDSNGTFFTFTPSTRKNRFDITNAQLDLNKDSTTVNLMNNQASSMTSVDANVNVSQSVKVTPELSKEDIEAGVYLWNVNGLDLSDDDGIAESCNINSEFPTNTENLNESIVDQNAECHSSKLADVDSNGGGDNSVELRKDSTSIRNLQNPITQSTLDVAIPNTTSSEIKQKEDTPSEAMSILQALGGDVGAKQEKSKLKLPSIGSLPGVTVYPKFNGLMKLLDAINTGQYFTLPEGSDWVSRALGEVLNSIPYSRDMLFSNCKLMQGILITHELANEPSKIPVRLGPHLNVEVGTVHYPDTYTYTRPQRLVLERTKYAFDPISQWVTLHYKLLDSTNMLHTKQDYVNYICLNPHLGYSYKKLLSGYLNNRKLSSDTYPISTSCYLNSVAYVLQNMCSMEGNPECYHNLTEIGRQLYNSYVFNQCLDSDLGSMYPFDLVYASIIHSFEYVAVSVWVDDELNAVDPNIVVKAIMVQRSAELPRYSLPGKLINNFNLISLYHNTEPLPFTTQNKLFFKDYPVFVFHNNHVFSTTLGNYLDGIRWVHHKVSPLPIEAIGDPKLLEGSVAEGKSFNTDYKVEILNQAILNSGDWNTDNGKIAEYVDGFIVYSTKVSTREYKMDFGKVLADADYKSWDISIYHGCIYNRLAPGQYYYLDGVKCSGEELNKLHQDGITKCISFPPHVFQNGIVDSGVSVLILKLELDHHNTTFWVFQDDSLLDLLCYGDIHFLLGNLILTPLIKLVNKCRYYTKQLAKYRDNNHVDIKNMETRKRHETFVANVRSKILNYITAYCLVQKIRTNLPGNLVDLVPYVVGSRISNYLIDVELVPNMIAQYSFTNSWWKDIQSHPLSQRICTVVNIFEKVPDDYSHLVQYSYGHFEFLWDTYCGNEIMHINYGNYDNPIRPYEYNDLFRILSDESIANISRKPGMISVSVLLLYLWDITINAKLSYDMRLRRENMIQSNVVGTIDIPDIRLNNDVAVVHSEGHKMLELYDDSWLKNSLERLSHNEKAGTAFEYNNQTFWAAANEWSDITNPDKIGIGLSKVLKSTVSDIQKCNSKSIVDQASVEVASSGHDINNTNLENIVKTLCKEECLPSQYNCNDPSQVLTDLVQTGKSTQEPGFFGEMCWNFIPSGNPSEALHKLLTAMKQYINVHHDANLDTVYKTFFHNKKDPCLTLDYVEVIGSGRIDGVNVPLNDKIELEGSTSRIKEQGLSLAEVALWSCLNNLPCILTRGSKLVDDIKSMSNLSPAEEKIFDEYLNTSEVEKLKQVVHIRGQRVTPAEATFVVSANNTALSSDARNAVRSSRASLTQPVSTTVGLGSDPTSQVGPNTDTGVLPGLSSHDLVEHLKSICSESDYKDWIDKIDSTKSKRKEAENTQGIYKRGHSISRSKLCANLDELVASKLQRRSEVNFIDANVILKNIKLIPSCSMWHLSNDTACKRNIINTEYLEKWLVYYKQPLISPSFKPANSINDNHLIVKRDDSFQNQDDCCLDTMSTSGLFKYYYITYLIRDPSLCNKYYSGILSSMGDLKNKKIYNICDFLVYWNQHSRYSNIACDPSFCGMLENTSSAHTQINLVCDHNGDNCSGELNLDDSTLSPILKSRSLINKREYSTNSNQVSTISSIYLDKLLDYLVYNEMIYEPDLSIGFRYTLNIICIIISIFLIVLVFM